MHLLYGVGFNSASLLVLVFFVWQAIRGQNKTLLLLAIWLSVLISLLFCLGFMTTLLFLNSSRSWMIVVLRIEFIISIVGFISAAVGLILHYQEVKRFGMPLESVRANEVKQ